MWRGDKAKVLQAYRLQVTSRLECCLGAHNPDHRRLRITMQPLPQTSVSGHMTGTRTPQGGYGAPHSAGGRLQVEHLQSTDSGHEDAPKLLRTSFCESGVRIFLPAFWSNRGAVVAAGHQHPPAAVAPRLPHPATSPECPPRRYLSLWACASASECMFDESMRPGHV
jgi:hypothetical protein